MPNTISSRSVGPLPPTSTTAGSRLSATGGVRLEPDPSVDGGVRLEPDPSEYVGRDRVPASTNPLPGILTCSSFGREMGTVRDDTDATSSRTNSSDCPG